MILSGYQPAQQVKPSKFFSVPFNEMYQGLAAKQSYYNYMSDKAEKAYDGLEGLMKNVDIWDSSKAAMKLVNFQSSLDAIKEKYPDFTDPMFLRELNKIVKTESSDPWWQQAMASKPVYEQWRKAYGESNAPMANKAQAYSLIEQASTAPEGATSLFKGQITNLAIPEYSDYGKTMHEIGKGVKPDASETVNIGGTWITKNKYKGINQEKLFNSLGINYKKDAQGNYLDSKGNPITLDEAGNLSGNVEVDRSNINYVLGAEDMRQLQLEAKFIASQNPRLSEKEVLDVLYLDKAQSVANAYSFTETGQDINANPYGLKAADLANSKALEDYKQQKQEETNIEQLVYGNKNYANLPDNLGNYSSDIQGFIDIVNNPNSSAKEVERAKRILELNGVTPTGVDYPSDTSEKSLTAYADALMKTGNPTDALTGEIMKKLIENNPQRQGESAKDYNDRLNEGYVNFKNSYKETELNIITYKHKKEVDDISSVVIGSVSGTEKNKTANLGTIVNKGIVLLDPETGASSVMSFDTFLGEVVGADAAEFVAGARITGKADGVNDFSPTGYAGHYKDNKGKSYNFVVTQTNYQEAKINEPVFKLSQPLFNPITKQSETSVGELNLSNEGMKFLNLKPNQTIVSKRVDNFDKLEYQPKVELYVRTYNGNTYSEEPYTIKQNQEVYYPELEDFIDLYNTMHK